MALEDPRILLEKNKKRMRDPINLAYAVGVNVIAPSPNKDSLRIISVMLIVVSCLGAYGHVAFIMRHKDSVIEIAESICTLFQIFIGMVKLVYMTFERPRFCEILKKIQTHELIDQIDLLANETPYNKELRRESVEIFDNCWTISMRQMTLYLTSCTSCMAYYFFGAIGINTYNSIIGNTNHTNVLAFPTLFPFWEDKMNQFPYYPILTFVVGTAEYVAGTVSIGFDGIFIFMAMHGVALFRILKKIIALATSPSVPKKLRVDYLRQCIVHYEKTYQYCIDINTLYLHISFMQFLLSLTILGVVMFQMALGLKSNLSDFLRMVLYLSSASFQVLIYCLNGQFITVESESMPFAWYECEWYNQSREFKQLIKMMIIRSNSVIIMKASWFTTMSLPTFLQIFNKSYSYFLLLRNMAF